MPEIEPDCSGPTGEEYSKPHRQCIGSAYQTSCTGSETCFYGFSRASHDAGDKSSWFSGRLVPGQGLKISVPDLLASIGISAGAIIDEINGEPLVDDMAIKQALLPFGPDTPATVYTATCLLGRFQLSLVH